MYCSWRVWVSIGSDAELGNASKGAARGGQARRSNQGGRGEGRKGREKGLHSLSGWPGNQVEYVWGQRTSLLAEIEWGRVEAGQQRLVASRT